MSGGPLSGCAGSEMPLAMRLQREYDHIHSRRIWETNG
jgi:hypothetical protein